MKVTDKRRVKTDDQSDEQEVAEAADETQAQESVEPKAAEPKAEPKRDAAEPNVDPADIEAATEAGRVMLSALRKILTQYQRVPWEPDETPQEPELVNACNKLFQARQRHSALKDQLLQCNKELSRVDDGDTEKCKPLRDRLRDLATGVLEWQGRIEHWQAETERLARSVYETIRYYVDSYQFEKTAAWLPTEALKLAAEIEAVRGSIAHAESMRGHTNQFGRRMACNRVNDLIVKVGLGMSNDGKLFKR